MSQYLCIECGWVYDETKGVPERGIKPGTKWEDVPDDFKCEWCPVKKGDSGMWQKI